MNSNVNIYVFSGTGNTLIVANKISEILNSNSYNSTVLKMESVEPKQIELNSAIGIGFTTAFWNTFPLSRLCLTLPWLWRLFPLWTCRRSLRQAQHSPRCSGEG